MSKYLISADRTGGAKECLDSVCEKISKAGHDVDKGPVNPGIEAYFARTVKNKSEIGVAIVNGICLGTMHSMYDDLIKTGKMEQIIYAIPFNIMDPKFKKKEDLFDESKKLIIVRDGTSWPERYYKDNKKWTADEAFKQYPGIDYVYGETGEDCAQAILDGNFGGTGDGSDDSTSDNQGEQKPMSGWESLLDLIKPYDGEIFLLVRGDTVVCKRIEIPEWSAIWAYEGVNIVDDSVTVTDYSPEIYNTIEVQYGSNYQNSIVLSFNKHVELFGERKTEIQANKKVSQEEYDEYQKWLKNKDGETTQKPSKPKESKKIDIFVEKEKKITDEELNSDYESPMDKFLEKTFGIKQPNQR